MIPFNKSSLQGKELDYIHETIEVGQVAGDQMFSRKCQEVLQDALGVRKALVTTSCTHALEMAGILLDLKADDEVVLPSFTFVSTANAFVLRGAIPVFCDIRSDTLNLDETKLEALITARTKAIVCVHYAGVGCEMEAIMKIANYHGVAVIEDNAHGLFGKYKGRWLGTFGQMATQSFHETKNITCGEGGALLINDPKYEERAEIIREKGTNRARYFRGQVDKYSWVDIGSSYVMSDVLAAFLYGQLEKWRSIQTKREVLWKQYDEALSGWAETQGIRRPFVPEDCEQAYHMYYLIMPSLVDRSDFIEFLTAQQIKAVFHYLPLHLSSFAKDREVKLWQRKTASECPVTEAISDKLVRIPLYTDMSPDETSSVVNAILKWHPQSTKS
jgi:dTDP-4-amino-4,6-dideoxygalactose transaminase